MGNHTEQHDTSVRINIKVIEDEVLALEKQELDLLTQLRLLRDTIARKRLLTKNLKNFLVSVNRLPNEILLVGFEQSVQNWVDENDGADRIERAKAKDTVHCHPAKAVNRCCCNMTPDAFYVWNDIHGVVLPPMDSEYSRSLHSSKIVQILLIGLETDVAIAQHLWMI
ncbi:hypothetical protein BJ138DRAFT_1183337 [Hygrophoropsis aurantiaca]|uniref:Uncharacterized protein n=1 Tax=Hygrophoropsis aurantiaca TaxID=72124 RepID=A0ACB7ZY02_9AGAM|nr:hypothetical protein BJ138DRAFT_1183337 [Hygrophoropsis aurantiaca]